MLFSLIHVHVLYSSSTDKFEALTVENPVILQVSICILASFKGDKRLFTYALVCLDYVYSFIRRIA
jgi:hypothetical protein